MMRSEFVDRLRLELVIGDIPEQPEFEAVVNAANAELRPGGGVAGALHQAAGPGLEAECRPYAPLRPGEAVITSGHRLPNRYVIHCLGPVFGRDEPAAELLAECYRKACRLAEHEGIGSIAFPAISTGAFGYPAQEAAQIAIDLIAATADRLRAVRRVRFVLFDSASFAAHDRALSRVVHAHAPSTAGCDHRPARHRAPRGGEA